VAITDQVSEEDARSAALSACIGEGLTSCEIEVSLQNNCASFAKSSIAGYSSAIGDNLDQAGAKAVATCAATHPGVCTVAFNACDATPVVEQDDTPTWDFSFLKDPRYWRATQIMSVSASAACAIVFALLLWLVVAVVSTVKLDVLKRRAAISAWIALPSAPVAPMWAFTAIVPAGYFAAIIWTDVYTALIIAVGLRRLLINRLNAPAVLSLPIASLVLPRFPVVRLG
jgi:hypothetical protein